MYDLGPSWTSTTLHLLDFSLLFSVHADQKSISDQIFSRFPVHNTVVEVLKVMNCARQKIYIFGKLMVYRML